MAGRKGMVGRKGPRPEVWIEKDPTRRTQRLSWQRHKAQAKFRGEEHRLSLDEFIAVWGDNWERRGMFSNDYCLHRKDKTKAWDTENTICIPRSEYLMELRK